MTEHESIQAMLALYAAEALEPAEAKRVEQHADGCEICKRELLAWNCYAGGLLQLPQPVAPAGLMERTRSRIMDRRAASITRRREAIMLSSLMVFGWAASLVTWIIVRVFTGGTLQVLGANLVSGFTWPLVSTAFVWMTAAAAAAMLGRRNNLRSHYEPVS
jgi:hypothetical protein